MKALDFSYDKVVNGIPGVDSASEMAEQYLAKNGSIEDKIDRLITWQNTKAGTSGFLAGLGGLITMPVAIPANFASVIYIQMRMIATIAVMNGHDLKDDRVKTFIYACLTGNAVGQILKDVVLQVGKKVALNSIHKISGKTLIKINQKVGFRLLTKFGETGAINLGKAVPILGGIVGATFDAVSTQAIGKAAKKVFVDKDSEVYFPATSVNQK